ncbi:chaperone protein ClpD [Populus alba x Populus x berolinensis]|uniref:Chaperone protein ClpD n=2 Tax=Populus alba x Populus x berolinensis TaxID=444605 RepID=A0AAD6LPW0_9ROSI|nr:chaperone protein ClpD [Populus alba x Populus x berolinensis]
MEVLLSSSSPLSVHSRLDFYALRKPKDPTFAFHSSNSNAISSSFSSCFGISISQRLQSKKTLLLKRFNSSKKRRILQVSAVFERFTERAIKAVIFSQREAIALGKDTVFTQHLLLGLISEDCDPKGFLGSGIKIDEAREVVKSTWDSESDSGDASESVSKEESGVSPSNVPFSISTKRVFEAAVEYSRAMGHNFIAPEHIAIGLFTVEDGNADRVFNRFGVDGDHMAAIAVTKLQGELVKDGREPSVESKGKREKSFSKKAARDKSALAQFCVDLTARASEGLIDPVIGRHSEIERIVQILCRRAKNNPILLGESGVGKTAIAEGLATSIAQADVPVFLLEKRVMSLDVGLLIAGAKERGELEARVTTLIREILKEGNIILFVDEVHTLVGSGTVGKGNKGSGLDIANLLKPSLGRGEFQCIASTTVDEYRTHFENDKALARRFQPVLINEPSQEDAVRILLGLRQKYEAHHNCRFTLEAINAAVNLSARYIADRYLPDKAIDLIDEAGSRARIEAYRRKKEQKSFILSKSPDDYWQEIRTVQAMHEVVLASRLTNDDSASTMDGTGEITLESRLPPALNDDEPPVVGRDDIAAVASLWSGIPVQQLTAEERMFLVDLEEELRKRVIGQDEAIAAISRAVKRSRVGLKDPDRPIAAMLFCGPTGVGKTELTKALARSYFGSESAMLRLDMSEYMERHTVSKLIGAPPGYVGYGEGGILTEAIRKQPFTVVLLDEIEKAHPDIFNILLQLFEDGHLTDSQGRRVSFKNALVVMTSNVGSTAIAKGGRVSIGFMIADDENSSYAAIKSLVMEELKGYFRPELLNRIDEVVVFHPLEKAQTLQILNIMLQEVKERLVSLGIGLEVSESIKDLVCQQGYDKFYGARPLRRAVTQIIENPLSEAFLAGDFKPGDTAFFDLDASGNPVVSHWSAMRMHLSDTTSTF